MRPPKNKNKYFVDKSLLVTDSEKKLLIAALKSYWKNLISLAVNVVYHILTLSISVPMM